MKETIEALMMLAYEAGKWAGQVDLEESMDNNFYNAFMQGQQTKKDQGVNHDTSLPQTIDFVEDKNGEPIRNKDGSLKIITRPDMNGKYVRYKLRSDKWRKGVRKSSKESVLKYTDILFNTINK